MDFDKLKKLILDADTNGTLITSKHDPDKANTIFSSFRTVVSKQVADNLIHFINEEKYSIKEYHNTNYPLSPLYYTITPYLDSQYSIASSGITGNYPTSALDTLVIVSGGTAGIHMYGNSSSDIQNKVSSGKLINERILKE
ncbi:MAG: hypothetical protein KA807_02585 [Prolixibacteraceae bacterium]|nr:hypothetical protein [Prolixibacteraceae bacterium]